MVKMVAMARARLGWDDRGRLVVFASHRAPTGRMRKRRIIPGKNVELGEEVVRQLNRDFALGDLSFFEEPVVKAPPRRAHRTPAFDVVADAWLESVRPPEIEESTYRGYASHVKSLKTLLLAARIGEVGPETIRRVRSSIGRATRTVDSRLAVLRLVLEYARSEGFLDRNPFDELPRGRRRTKRGRAARAEKRISFKPYSAAELGAILQVVRSPRNAEERRFFPLTEALLLTGLRFGEPAAWVWPDLSGAGGWIDVARALPKHGVIRLGDHPDLEAMNRAFPPKTGAPWGLPIRPPLADLFMRQRQVSYVGRPEGWMFPNSRGDHLTYRNWLVRGLTTVLTRAKVPPRPREKQKAFRRSYITNSLICGRNPKEISEELGHTTPRMVLTVYDSFLRAENWPSDEERCALARIYGWPEPPPSGSRVALEERA